MSPRSWISLLLLVALGATTAVLVANEEVVDPDARTNAELRAEDPLLDMRFRPEERSHNLDRLVFHPEDVTAVETVAQGVAESTRAGDPENSRVRYLLANTPDRALLEDSLCATGRQAVPPRYGALAFLVTDDGQRREVVDLARVRALEPQAWVGRARVRQVYATVELVADRKPDAFVMALGAILTGKEQELLDHQAPWGRSLFQSWSWEDFGSKWPEARVQVQRYVATMAVVLEEALADGGVCPRPEGGPG